MRIDALAAALGRRAADKVVDNGRVVNVTDGTVTDGGVAIVGERIVAAGEVKDLIGPSTTVIDADGRFLTPGLIETHMHLYECNLNPTELTRIVLSHGTTTLCEAMYGAGQISGVEAVRFFIEELRRTPINVLLQVPVLGYLQNRELGLPPTPTGLSREDLLQIIDWDGCVGLEEPPFIPMAEREPVILELVDRTLARGQRVMGHGAGLNRSELAAYAAMGVSADHEATSAEEALERLAAGMMVSMRESVVAHNQQALQRAITAHGADPSAFMFCADVLEPVTAARIGHLDHSIRLAVSGGVDPVAAIQMASINAARYYRVDDWLGSLTPGRQADLLLVDSLDRFTVEAVIVKGQLVAERGRLIVDLRRPQYPETLRDTVKLAEPATAETFRLDAGTDDAIAMVRVIGGEQLASDERRLDAPVVAGQVVADPDRDIVKLAMLDRFGRPQPAAIGFLQGYGLRRGAIGTTYNPMYHNILIAGIDDEDMALAANALVSMHGGFVAVSGGEVLAAVPLPLCGLMSDQPADRFLSALERLYAVVAELGCGIEAPFHNLAFTGVCGELPQLKLSHLGLFDVAARRPVPTLIKTERAAAAQT